MSTDSSQSPGALVPRTRRVKLRQGTTSCWECKYRKIRCLFELDSPDVCASCRRRGCDCVSQEVPEEPVVSENDVSYQDMDDQILRLESFVQFLVQEQTLSNVRRRPATKNYSTILGKRARDPEPSGDKARSKHRPARQFQPLLLQDPSRDRFLSRFVYTFLPVDHMAATILRGSYLSTLPVGVIQATLKSESPSAVFRGMPPIPGIPSSTAEPITLARTLLRLAVSLQEMGKDIEGSLDLDLPADIISRQYFEAATRFVLSQDTHLLSFEGLETLMLESVYHVNTGDWQAAWRGCRRALKIGQQMRLHLPEHQRQHRSATVTPEGIPTDILWIRIVSADGYLSHILGYPPASSNSGSAAEEAFLRSAGGPLREMEKIHLASLSRIRYGDKMDHKKTQKVDSDLKRARKLYPTAWWALPKKGESICAELAPDVTSRLLLQTHHYNVMLVLHLPYVLRGLHAQQNYQAQEDMPMVAGDMYNTLTAVNASRELMLRFISYFGDRSCPFSSKGTGFKAFLAICTILLAHIDGHGLGEGNVLEHQHPPDLGLVNDAMSIMELVVQRSDDEYSRSCLGILRMLVEIENVASSSASPFRVWSEPDAPYEANCYAISMDDGLDLSIPYFGRVYIRPQHRIPIGPADNAASQAQAFSSLPPNLQESIALSEWWPPSRQRLFQSLDDDYGGGTEPSFFAPLTQVLPPSGV